MLPSRRPSGAIPPPPAAPPQPDRPTLLHAALAEVLATAQARTNGHANGHASPPAPDDQQSGVCSLHQAAMERRTDPTTGDTWYSHRCEDTGRYCKGAKRPRRTNGHRH